MSGYGAEGCVRLTDSHTVPFSPTHPYDHRQQRQHREQAGREASWLKQVRKVKRVGESEKWVTRPRGGRSKKTLVKKTFDWCDSRVKSKKRLNHVC